MTAFVSANTYPSKTKCSRSLCTSFQKLKSIYNGLFILHVCVGLSAVDLPIWPQREALPNAAGLQEADVCKHSLTVASSDAFLLPATVLLSVHAAMQRCVLLPHIQLIYEFALTSPAASKDTAADRRVIATLLEYISASQNEEVISKQGQIPAGANTEHLIYMKSAVATFKK